MKNPACTAVQMAAGIINQRRPTIGGRLYNWRRRSPKEMIRHVFPFTLLCVVNRWENLGKTSVSTNCDDNDKDWTTRTRIRTRIWKRSLTQLTSTKQNDVRFTWVWPLANDIWVSLICNTFSCNVDIVGSIVCVSHINVPVSPAHVTTELTWERRRDRWHTVVVLLSAYW